MARNRPSLAAMTSSALVPMLPVAPRMATRLEFVGPVVELEEAVVID